MSAPRANKYFGVCALCGGDVPARAGLLRKAREPRVNTYDGPGGLRTSVSYWDVVHRPPEWVGSPVSGRWVGGCPEEVDR
jgi:hypothetical protein